MEPATTALPAGDDPLGQLGISLAELTSLMTDVKAHSDERYEAMGEQLATLTARIDRLDEGDDDDDEEEEEHDPAKFRPWTARADRAAWLELIGWVDWMQRAYSLTGHALDPVPPCWPAHQNVVEELAALYSSWRAAMADDVDGKGVSDASLYWHDRWLWPTRERLSTSFLERCRVGQHEGPKPPQRTDPGHIPQGVPSTE